MGWLEHMQSKYKNESHENWNDTKLISESDRIIRQFRDRPKKRAILGPGFRPPKLCKFLANPQSCPLDSNDCAQKSDDDALDEGLHVLEARKCPDQVAPSRQQTQKQILKEKQIALERADNRLLGKRRNNQDVPTATSKKIMKKKPQEADLQRSFRAVENMKQRRLFVRWRSAAENLKESEVQAELMHNLAIKRRAWFKLTIRTKTTFNRRLEELTKVRQLEAVGDAYSKRFFWTRYLRLWMNRYRDRIRFPLSRPDKEQTTNRQHTRSQKSKPKKYKFIKKPPLPPIVPDPFGEEMLQKAVGVRQKKVEEIKKKMKAEELVKQEQEAQQRRLDDKKRHNHILSLAREKQKRIEKSRAEQIMAMAKAKDRQQEEISEMANKQRLLRWALRLWKRLPHIRFAQIADCSRRTDLALMKRHLQKMLEQCRQRESGRESQAFMFYRKFLFAKTMAGIKKAQHMILLGELQVQQRRQHRIVCHCFKEWKEARMLKRRQMKIKADKAFRRTICLRALHGLRAGLVNIAESRRRKAFRAKMLGKAQELLGEASPASDRNAYD